MKILKRATIKRAITKTIKMNKMLEKVNGTGVSVVPSLKSSVFKMPLKEKSEWP